MNRSEILLPCPYENSHRIRQIAMGRHLIKCGKNHPYSTKVKCPFDATHVEEPEDMKEHMALCPSSVHQNQFQFEPLVDLTSTLPFTEVYERAKYSENWDEVHYDTSYDPMKATEDREVLRCIPGKTKSQRKKFRIAERLRFQNIKKNSIAQMSTLKMLAKSAKIAHERTKVLLHELLFPENIGIDRLTIEDKNVYLENIGFHKLAIRDTDLKDVKLQNLHI